MNNNQQINFIIVIPAYKPKEILLDIVDDLYRYFPYIIVVDDGSGEKYSALFERLKYKSVVLKHYVNLGKGRALKTAFNEAIHIMASESGIQWGGVITVDADGQHLVKDVVAVGGMLGNENSLILGCRKFAGKGVPFRSRLGNIATRLVFRWLCGLNVSDTQTGLRGYPAEYLETCCKIDGERYEYETNVLLNTRKEDIKIREISIETIYEDQNNTSHFNPLFDSIKIYKVIFEYSLSSIVAVLIDFFVFHCGIQMGISILWATYMGRLVSACGNFALNRNLVFKSKNRLQPQLVKYFLLVAGSGTISACLVWTLSRFLACRLMIIKVAVEGILYFFNYYIQNTMIFSKRKGEGD